MRRHNLRTIRDTTRPTTTCTTSLKCPGTTRRGPGTTRSQFSPRIFAADRYEDEFLPTGQFSPSSEPSRSWTRPGTRPPTSTRGPGTSRKPRAGTRTSFSPPGKIFGLFHRRNFRRRPGKIEGFYDADKATKRFCDVFRTLDKVTKGFNNVDNCSKSTNSGLNQSNFHFCKIEFCY